MAPNIVLGNSRKVLGPDTTEEGIALVRTGMYPHVDLGPLYGKATPEFTRTTVYNRGEVIGCIMHAHFLGRCVFVGATCERVLPAWRHINATEKAALGGFKFEANCPDSVTRMHKALRACIDHAVAAEVAEVAEVHDAAYYRNLLVDVPDVVPYVEFDPTHVVAVATRTTSTSGCPQVYELRANGELWKRGPHGYHCGNVMDPANIEQAVDAHLEEAAYLLAEAKAEFGIG